jgi:hypothetical protein
MYKEYSSPINVNDLDIDMKLGVYTWFPYQSSAYYTEVYHITLLDSWVISAQGHFTKNTDLFPRNISNSLNGCPMKVLYELVYWKFTLIHAVKSEFNLMLVQIFLSKELFIVLDVLKKMNMPFVHNTTLAEITEEKHLV